MNRLLASSILALATTVLSGCGDASFVAHGPPYSDAGVSAFDVLRVAPTDMRASAPAPPSDAAPAAERGDDEPDEEPSSETPPAELYDLQHRSRSRLMGGRLSVTKRDREGIDVDLSIRNGAHSGRIAGRARWSGATAHLRNDASIGTYGASCLLRLTEHDGGFEITESPGCSYFHGARVSFEGRYSAARSPVRPSFSCHENLPPSETVICRDEVLADADRALAAAYQNLLDRRPDDPAVPTSQHAWLAERDRACAPWTRDPPEAGSPEEEEAIRCLLRRYIPRLRALRRNVLDWPADAFTSLPSHGADLRARLDPYDLFELPELTGTLRVLLGPELYDLRDLMGVVCVGIADGENVVFTGGTAGLYTYAEGMVAFGPRGDLWIGMRNGHGNDEPLRLFTLDAQRDEKPIAAFERWSERFENARVERHVARYNAPVDALAR